MINVWLDDERDPNKFGRRGWVWIRTAEDCIVYLEMFWKDISQISLDHDLGDVTKKTGYDVSVWIEERVCLDGWNLPVVHIHSQNPVGKKRMESALIFATQFVARKNITSVA